MLNMSEKGQKLKALIRKYILDIGGLLKEEIDEPKLEFGFRFIYPHQNGRLLIVLKTKKTDFIEISCPSNLPDQYINALNSLEERDKSHFAKRLQKEILFNKSVDFMYDFSVKFTVVVMDRIYIEQDTISKNEFFRIVRNIYSTANLIVFFVEDFFSEDLRPTE
jgi:hypothetical protein